MLWVGNVGEVGGLLGGWETPPFALDFQVLIWRAKETRQVCRRLGEALGFAFGCGSQLLRVIGVRQVLAGCDWTWFGSKSACHVGNVSVCL